MASKAEVWRERLAACRASGLSTAAYCREHGVSYAQYMYWQRRLGKPATGLVPVRVEASTATTASMPLSVEVKLPREVMLRVHGATAADVLILAQGLAC